MSKREKDQHEDLDLPARSGRHDTRGGRSPRPQPRLPGKNRMNPPIVTVFGAGVTGLTVAHELVERGFLVQVIDKKEDCYNGGVPVVGGMAANQQARVRGNIEDLHRDLLLDLASGDGEIRKAAAWFLRVASWVRAEWIETERPKQVECHLYGKPDDQHLKNNAPEEGAFHQRLVRKLVAAKAEYKRNWLWDLVLRPMYLGAAGDVTEADPKKLLEELVDLDSGALIERIHQIEREGRKAQAAADPGGTRRNAALDLPTLTADSRSKLAAALDREFLCFRLIPHARVGRRNAADQARELLESWIVRLAKEPELRNCIASSVVSEPRPRKPDEPKRGPAYEKENATVFTREAPRLVPPDRDAWLEIELVELKLPGEHGYRFFPSYYRHLEDTMKRIPLFDEHGDLTGRTVYDNLRPTVFQGLGIGKAGRSNNLDQDWSCGQQPPERRSVIPIHRDRARSFEGLRDRTDRFLARIGARGSDGMFFLARMLRYMTSCPERRRKEYEKMTWEEFAGIAHPGARDQQLPKLPRLLPYSEAMKTQMRAASQALVGYSVSEADARTYGNVATQLLLDQLEDGARTDRTLNGPTSTAWLEPWRQYLEMRGVRFFCGEVKALKWTTDGEKGVLTPEVELRGTWQQDRRQDDLLEHKEVRQYGDRRVERFEAEPDFYVLAVNLEKAAELIQNLPSGAPCREAACFKDTVQLHELARGSALKNITGIQLFLDAKTSIGRGHMYFPHSKWGLSSISQSEFWLGRGGYAEGYLGVLSVDVCDFGDPDDLESYAAHIRRVAPPMAGRAAGHLKAAKSILEEIGGIVEEPVDANGVPDILPIPRYFHVDQSIEVVNGSVTNEARYLASPPSIAALRPGRDNRDDGCVGEKEINYDVVAERWVVCGTFAATHTRMTTMEAANESARHAVRAILRAIEKDGRGEPAAIAFKGESERSIVSRISNVVETTKYNGGGRHFDPPDIWPLEDREPEDLDIMKRIDRRLLDLGLPHFMDIIDLDRKLVHAVEAADIYDEEQKAPSLERVIGLAVSAFDAGMTKERGRAYADDLKVLQAALEKLKAKAPRYPSLESMLARFVRANQAP